MANVLRIGNFVEFPVSIAVKDGEVEKTFKFRLTGARLSSKQWRDHFEQFKSQAKEDGSKALDALDAAQALLLKNISGWQEQTLVVDDISGQPADFSPDSFGLVLDLIGAVPVIQSAYVEALGIKEGGTAKDARAKN